MSKSNIFCCGQNSQLEGFKQAFQYAQMGVFEIKVTVDSGHG